LIASTALAETRISHPGANLIFISLDALQAAHVHALGYERETTPALDALAKRSFVFQNNTSVASWTVPASMTWFTGVYPSEHRMTNKFAVYNATEKKPANLKELAPELITLAEILKQNGYATGGFTGNAGMSGGFGYEQGFDEYYYDRGKFGGLEESVPRAVAWLKKHRDEKFFLFLHGYDVHGQFMPRQGFDFRFVEKDYDQKYRGTPQEQEILREEGLERGRVKLRDADVRFWRAIYDEKIQRADAWVKQFLDEVEALSLTDKTIIVVTSDHGTEVYEHQRFDHGFTLYQELLHVPLFIALPKQTQSQRIDDRVSSIDLMPTMLDLLGIEMTDKVKQQLRGESLSPALRGERSARDVFSETDYREFTYQRSIIDAAGYKLIYTLETRTRQLFDLNKDPGETKNLAAADPKRADELERRLFAHYRAIGHDLKSQRWEVGLNPVYDSQAKEPKK
jgi:arylsulfatase A-like enzyme